MKQPHEGVTGVSRDDYLLSLDNKAVAYRDALITMTGHLRDACCVGNAVPIVERMWQRISHPQPGDLVVEVSAMARRADADTRLKGFGILIEHRVEWWETDERWESYKAEDGTLEDDDRRTDHAWYVQYGPDAADVCRWANCDFRVVPIGREDFTMPVGQRDADGVTFRRDDLVSGLADSGFALRLPHPESETL